MDSMSNLSKTLPGSLKPINKNSIINKNKEILTEFKNGAKSITKLFQLSNSLGEIYLNQGYLNCINDLLNLIQNSKETDLEYIKEFLIFKKQSLFDDEESNTQSDNDTNNDNKNNKNNDNDTDAITRQEIKKDNNEDMNQESEEEVYTQDITNDVNILRNNNIIINNNNNTPIEDVNLLKLEDYKFGLVHDIQKKFPKSKVPMSIDYSKVKNTRGYNNTHNHIHNNNNNNNIHNHTSHNLIRLKESKLEQEDYDTEEMDESVEYNDEDREIKRRKNI